MKRIASLLLVIMLCFGLMMPANVSATSTVRINYNGVSKSYQKKATSLYVNNTVIGVKGSPIFMKSGCYMGIAAKIFKKSSLKVAITYTNNNQTMTMRYGSKTLVMNSGSKKAILNGQSKTLGGAPMYASYGSKAKKWIVPLKSVCISLGISYGWTNGVLKIGGTTNSSPTTSPSVPTTPTTPTTPSSSDGQIVLVLDAGHGGSDSGATGNGLKEKNLTLAIVLAAKKYFDNDSKFKVYYTRTADTYPSLTDRCNLANNNKADLFLCVHINSATASARGTETLYNSSRNAATAKNGITSKDLATAMQNAAVASTGFINRGLKVRTDLRVLNATTMPACLIEYGFVSNQTEALILNANTSRYGKELYEAVVNFYRSKNKY